MGVVTGTSSGDEENTLPKRLCLRVLTEFVLYGILTDLKSIIKIVSGAAGAPSDGNKEYIVTDANAVVTFAKTGGHEIFGVVPRAIRLEYERLQKEVAGIGEGMIENLSQVSTEPSDSKQKENALDNIETSFVPTLSKNLVANAQSVIESYDSTVPYSRAVSQSTSETLHKHCLGAYHTIANSYIATHKRLLKLEKRCEQDRLLQGNLSEAREKGLVDARTLLENLQKSVETLSDVLDVDPPALSSSDEDENTEATDAKGISLWTKNENDVDENLGPFDDEETRAFYCDVPDFLETKPAALLGLNQSDFEKQKERNEKQYGGVGGEESDIAAMEVEDVETKDDELDEVNEIDTEDVTIEGKVEDEANDGGKYFVEDNQSFIVSFPPWHILPCTFYL